ncbi:MAG: hypothetical protein V1704_01210 [Candidatus Vogelbacteria bacterium]
MNGDTSMNNFPINDQPSKGPLLGTIIIVLIIIIGGIYIITSRGNNEVVPPPPTEPTGIVPTEDQSQTALDGLSSVETDLASSTADLDTLINEIK